ncbi:Hypothetical Protein FCC1311_049052 [Hondaea fermentalgiana]|uniref:Uncharacterized protein n=1 Tax=Hondaea fermentalgiana TaxID=2315210 RepID=A0A2R5GLD0_9STRA|nr:Hypothetical Protein FCC1311_049052 [Hondaea fermentalgiana]|eukprot:GBG28684.1 Hypothetical Protein FCC1311_049052 [Hondaea fermentalgiana]
MLEDGRADEKIFGVMCEVDRRRGANQRLFIGYGAHAKDCHSNGSKPKIDVFEIREENTNQKWILDASSKDVSRFALTEDRDGPSACIFETPVGSVESGLTYKFAARSRNEDGYWSDWCSTETAVKANHWIADWKDEDVDSRVENSSKFKSESLLKSHATFQTHQKTQHQQGYLEGRGTTSAKASLRSAQHRQRLAMENAIRRESERLQFLKESGCDFMATLPDPWH